MSDEYWVDISQRGTRLGAGLLLTRCYVLTAYHCLGGAAEGAVLEVRFASKEKVQGKVHRIHRTADLALIDVPNSPVNLLFKADRARPGLHWRDPYRPDADDLCLDGTVSAVPVSYRCSAGDEVEAIQLTCNQLLGDYSGYSGSPVMRDYPDGSQGALGIMIEQCWDRAPGAQRATNVLMATSVAEAGRKFDCLDVSHLLHILYPDADSGPEPERPSASAGPQPTNGEAVGRRLKWGWTAGRRGRSELKFERERFEAGIHADRLVLQVLAEASRAGQVDDQAIHQLSLDVARRAAGRELQEQR
jgi:hypothetical protein